MMEEINVAHSVFQYLKYWHWLVLAVVLIILEIFAPSAFFMWMGAAAGITGIVLLAIPDMTWQVQFIIFSVMSIMAILLGRTFFSRAEINTDDPTLSQLESELTGNVYTVEKAIINGSGRIKVGESTWKAQGPDCAEGASVRVTGVQGAVLLVDLFNSD